MLDIPGKMKRDNPGAINAGGCSKSLQILVKFFRIFGFSFTGVLFGSDSNLANPKVTTKSTPLFSYFLLLYNILILLVYLVPISIDHLPPEVKESIFKQVHGTPFNQSITSVSFSEYFARIGNERDPVPAEYLALKPILRAIINWLIAVFFLDGWLAFGCNLLYGGRLLHQIAAISTEADSKDSKIAWIALGTLAIGIPVIMTAGVYIFNAELLLQHFEDGFSPDWETRAIELKRIEKMLTHIWHYINLSMYSILFITSMILARKRIDEIVTSSVYGISLELNEKSVLSIQDQLEVIEVHFQAMINCFEYPITFSLVASTFTIIGSVCFCMVSPDRSYATFIFSIGTFALFRLALVCWAGNLPVLAYRNLVRSLFEQLFKEKVPWTIDIYLAFGQIRERKSKFIVNYFAKTFAIRQSAILTLLAFAVNYIIVLLQTENYEAAKGKRVG